MPWCPFKDCECYPECPLFVPTVGRCQFVVRTMQLEDLHKLALITLDRMTEEEDAPRPAGPLPAEPPR